MDQSVEQLFDEGTKIIKSVLMKTKFNKMNKKAVINPKTPKPLKDGWMDCMCYGKRPVMGVLTLLCHLCLHWQLQPYTIYF